MFTNEYLSLLEVKNLVKNKEYIWKDKANCIGVDSHLFVPAENLRGKSVSKLYQQGKKYCINCKVRSECLAYSLVNDLDIGLFGGLTPVQRKSLHNKLTVREIFKKKDFENDKKI